MMKHNINKSGLQIYIPVTKLFLFNGFLLRCVPIQDVTYGGTAAIPESYLGQEYFVVVMVNPGPGQVVITTTGEPTLVRITPNAAFRYNEVLYQAGQDYDIEVPTWYQIVITTDTADFSGSRILANRSVSVISGSSCAYALGLTSGNCDYAIEQLVSFDRWGTKFYLAPFYDGAEGYHVLVTAGISDTHVTVDGSTVQLDMGMNYRLDVTTNKMIRVASDQPVQVIQFMKDSATMVTIPPNEQYTTWDTYFRLNGDEHTSTPLGFTFSHYFHIVVGCAGLGPHRTCAGRFRWQYIYGGIHPRLVWPRLHVRLHHARSRSEHL